MHVKDLRKKEKELEGSVLASNKYLINRETYVGIKHMETALQLDSEMEELKYEDSWHDDKIVLLKARLENIKTNLVKSFIFY